MFDVVCPVNLRGVRRGSTEVDLMFGLPEHFGHLWHGRAIPTIRLTLEGLIIPLIVSATPKKTSVHSLWSGQGQQKALKQTTKLPWVEIHKRINHLFY